MSETKDNFMPTKSFGNIWGDRMKKKNKAELHDIIIDLRKLYLDMEKYSDILGWREKLRVLISRLYKLRADEK